MKVLTVSEVLQQDEGTEIGAVKGLVKLVMKPKTVGKRNGTLQTVILVEGRKELPVKFWDHDEVPQSHKGKLIHVLAGEEGGLTVGSYDGKLNLSAKSDCEVAMNLKSGTDTAQPPKREEQEPDAGDGPPDDGGEPPADEPKAEAPKPETRADRERKAILAAKVEAMRLMNLDRICIVAVALNIQWMKDSVGLEMSDEFFKSRVASMRIDLVKANYHLDLPFHPLEIEVPASEQPAPAEAPPETEPQPKADAKAKAKKGGAK